MPLPLLLASTSAIRRAMLASAGVDHDATGAGIDETAVKRRLDDAGEVALELAKAKAQAVSARQPEAWVAGSDSVVSVDGRIFDKPADRAQAKAHLCAFSGRTMRLTSAVALARGGEVDWAYGASATLQVRPLSEGFIDSYLEREWPEVGYCVGVFRLEGLGVQLFERIDGDYFTILGMPLLPLLGALRERGLLAA